MTRPMPTMLRSKAKPGQWAKPKCPVEWLVKYPPFEGESSDARMRRWARNDLADGDRWGWERFMRCTHAERRDRRHGTLRYYRLALLWLIGRRPGV